MIFSALCLLILEIGNKIAFTDLFLKNKSYICTPKYKIGFSMR